MGRLGSLFGVKPPPPPSPLEDARRYLIYIAKHVKGFDGTALAGEAAACDTPEAMVSLIASFGPPLSERLGKEKSEQFTRRAYELLA